jgi:hypothetical protein
MFRLTLYHPETGLSFECPGGPADLLAWNLRDAIGAAMQGVAKHLDINVVKAMAEHNQLEIRVETV